MLLRDVVATTEAVAATTKRNEKRDALATLLRQAAPDEIVPLVGMLTGEPRQGALGTGWAGVSRIDVEPGPGGQLTVNWQKDGRLFLTGPAAISFHGELPI